MNTLAIYTIVTNGREPALEMFFTDAEEKARANEIMQEIGNPAVHALLQDGKPDEAWIAFREQMAERGEVWDRHENDVTLPEPYASGPELLQALQLARRDMGVMSPKVFDEEISEWTKQAMTAALAKAGKAAT